MPDLLSLVTTDLSKAEIVEYIYLVVTMAPNTLETLRIPLDNAYQAARIRQMSVLVYDTFQDNRDALHDFVFGKDESEMTSEVSGEVIETQNNES